MANDLQLALVGVGVAVVAGVWGYNTWQERGHRQRAEKVFGGKQDDVLMADAEPGSAGGEGNEAPRREPTFETREAASAAREHPAAEAKSLHALPPALADAVADCILRIEFVEAVSAPDLWAEQSGWVERLVKPLRWLAFDDEQATWRALGPHDGHYSQVAVALQLADRGGAASAAEIAAFIEGSHQLAQRFSGLVDLPDHAEVLEHAQALDQFCASVDMQLGIGVMGSSGGIPGTKLRGLAEASGLVLQDDGFFHAQAEDASTLFMLSNAGSELFNTDTLRTLTTMGVTLTLDVPRVVEGPAAFDRMMTLARQLADAVGGSLVDAAHKRPLDDAMIAAIRARIGDIQQRMRINQIPPGSVRALRLFS
jgi:hypothetical protein